MGQEDGLEDKWLERMWLMGTVMMTMMMILVVVTLRLAAQIPQESRAEQDELNR